MTSASEPKIFGPFSAMTGAIRQTMPTGEKWIIISIISMNTAFADSNTVAKGFALSPAIIIAKPTKSAITITWSIDAFKSGATIFVGNISATTCIKFLVSFAVYSAPVTSRMTNLLLKSIAIIVPIISAIKVVKR